MTRWREARWLPVPLIPTSCYASGLRLFNLPLPLPLWSSRRLKELAMVVNNVANELLAAHIGHRKAVPA